MSDTVKLKCGDIIKNSWASDRNPTRYFIFIEYSGKYAKCITLTGKGSAVRWARYYASELKNNSDGAFEVVGHLPVKESIAKALLILTGGAQHEKEE